MLIIAAGRVVADSTPQELRKQEGGELDEVFRKLTAAAAEKEESK
jgi:hypothetical protein